MIPISFDLQHAAKSPVEAGVRSLIAYSAIMGFVQACATLLFYIKMDWFIQGDLSNANHGAFGTTLYAKDGYFCNEYSQTCVWLQISISAELLIFSTRSRGLFCFSRPSFSLVVSTMLCGCLLSTFLAVYAFPARRNNQAHRGIQWDDAGIIWAYDLACFLVVDVVKLIFKHGFTVDASGVLDEARYAREDADRVPSPAAAPPLLAHRPSHRVLHHLHASAPRTAKGRLAAFVTTGKSMAPTAAAASTHYSQTPASDMRMQTHSELQRAASKPL
jgi:hypothetical protein